MSDNMGHFGDRDGTKMKGLIGDSLVLRAEDWEGVVNPVKKILH